jgi:hypothetical protein
MTQTGISFQPYKVLSSIWSKCHPLVLEPESSVLLMLKVITEHVFEPAEYNSHPRNHVIHLQVITLQSFTDKNYVQISCFLHLSYVFSPLLPLQSDSSTWGAHLSHNSSSCYTILHLLHLSYLLTTWHCSSCTIVAASHILLHSLLSADLNLHLLIPIFLRSSSTNCFHLSCTFHAFWFIQLFCTWDFVTMNFYSVGSLATCLNQPTWRTMVSLLVWHLHQNLSGMGGATSKAFELIGAHKPPHPATKCFQQGGDTILGASSFIDPHIFPSMFLPVLHLLDHWLISCNVTVQIT